ncbi:MAG: alkaline shock response membrane anchor protein AmaP [Candidatus Omnitrophica bacterium]|nr:alkaline shock response membrane anchor protein AmaP [Candidatus Omnitrophota bacterium]
MKVFTWIIMSCYMILFVLMGAGLVIFSLQGISIEGAVFWLQKAYTEKNLRLACFLTGTGLILLNWMIAQLTLAKLQQQKTIAFENPDGQVTVSLSAIEDFIRRSTRELPEVKDLRSDVVAKKGRILVRARVTLWSEAHIPEVTERIQGLVKSRVQEMLSGIEEPVLVKVHVAKIASREEAPSGPGRREDKITTTPFRGF